MTHGWCWCAGALNGVSAELLLSAQQKLQEAYPGVSPSEMLNGAGLSDHQAEVQDLKFAFLSCLSMLLDRTTCWLSNQSFRGAVPTNAVSSALQGTFPKMNSMDAATTDICALTRKFFCLLKLSLAGLLQHRCLPATAFFIVWQALSWRLATRGMQPAGNAHQCKHDDAYFSSTCQLFDYLLSAFVPSCADAAMQGTSDSRGVPTGLPSTLLTSMERAWGRAMRNQSAAIAAESPASGSTARIVATPATSGEGF